MRNFSLKTRANSRHNARARTLVTVTLITVIAVLLLIFFGRMLGSLSALVTSPLYVARNWIEESSAVLPSYLRSRGELIREMEVLRGEIAAQRGLSLTISRLTAENKELQIFLGAKEDNRILASVVARPPYIPYDGVLIDRGVTDGVPEGALVYYTTDAVIGFVSRVFTHSALVTLFSNPGTAASVFIAGPNVFATAVGEGGGVIRIGVPHGVRVQVGDSVLTPSLGSGILGIIQSVNSISTEPEQHAFVVGETPLQSLRSVSISTQSAPMITYEEALETLRTVSHYQFILAGIPPETKHTSPLNFSTSSPNALGTTTDIE